MEPYRCVASSVTGFVQQVACSYLRHGYYFFVQGRVPPGKHAPAVDRKLIEKYDIAASKSQRYRRRKQGLANLQYIRFERDWLMLATHGRHRWFRDERGNIRDSRKVPIRFRGYSMRVQPGGFQRRTSSNDQPQPDGRPRVRVLIARDAYRELKQEFLAAATRRHAEQLSAKLYSVPYEPYAPIRKQLLALLRQVNAARQRAGYTKLPTDAIRYRRSIVKPFE